MLVSCWSRDSETRKCYLFIHFSPVPSVVFFFWRHAHSGHLKNASGWRPWRLGSFQNLLNYFIESDMYIMVSYMYVTWSILIIFVDTLYRYRYGFHVSKPEGRPFPTRSTPIPLPQRHRDSWQDPLCFFCFFFRRLWLNSLATQHLSLWTDIEPMEKNWKHEDYDSS